LAEDEDTLDGEVEVDETYIGSKAKNMHRAERAIRRPGRRWQDSGIWHGRTARRSTG
jgi:hypothetical protein